MNAIDELEKSLAEKPMKPGRCVVRLRKAAPFSLTPGMTLLPSKRNATVMRWQQKRGGTLPTLTVTYIKQHVMTRGLWSDLHTNGAEERLKGAIRRHLQDRYGMNIAEQILAKFSITPEMLAVLRQTYRAY